MRNKENTFLGGSSSAPTIVNMDSGLLNLSSGSIFSILGVCRGEGGTKKEGFARGETGDAIGEFVGWRFAISADSDVIIVEGEGFAKLGNTPGVNWWLLLGEQAVGEMGTGA